MGYSRYLIVATIKAVTAKFIDPEKEPIFTGYYRCVMHLGMKWIIGSIIPNLAVGHFGVSPFAS